MALLQILRQPELSAEDAEWVEQFAVRTITQFSMVRDDRKLEEPVRA